ncbi:unnamed protein product [Rhizophagus irregularis]|nr:unnamed protein product [Rhizophagus irregularis]
MQDFEIDNESDELDGINIGCLPEVDELREYLRILCQDIPTVEQLNDEQIINLLQNEDESDDDSSDEDQQEFNVDNLRIFQKYLRMARIREINLKKQSTLYVFLENSGRLNIYIHLNIKILYNHITQMCDYMNRGANCIRNYNPGTNLTQYPNLRRPQIPSPSDDESSPKNKRMKQTITYRVIIRLWSDYLDHRVVIRLYGCTITSLSGLRY